MNILIIEDSTDIIDVVAQTINLRWPEANMISTTLGEKGIEFARKESPDIVILDLGLPDMDGFQVLRQIRGSSDIPVIILTVRGEEMDKIRGLELGADDYIVKPFSPGEFLARIKAATRGNKLSEATSQNVGKPFIRGNMRIDFSTRELSVGEKLIKLSPSEYDLLFELATNEGLLLSKHILLQKVWGSESSLDTEYVDVYIKRLNETLKEEPGHPVVILNKGDRGYMLVSS